jgi:hypothetical protein
MRVLVVEDEPYMAKAIRDGLRLEAIAADIERGEADSLAFIRERHPRKNPAPHAELRMIIDDRTERQRRWAFRAIAAENANSVLSRLRNATRLTRGQFYVGTDGTKFIKTATPICLSHHPAAPLTEEEEVLARARADR